MIFHKDVYLPDHLIECVPATLYLTWSSHALSARKSDRYGSIKHFDKINVDADTIIEISEESGGYKILLRLDYDEKFDISVVILIRGETHLVKTVWLNDKQDKHSTLKRHKYQQK